MLDLVDETFDQMALTIQPMIVITRLLGVWARGNDHFCTTGHNQRDKSLRTITALRNHVLKLENVEQIRCLGDVMVLPAGQAQPQGIAQTIDRDVNFGAEPAATAPQRLIILISVFFGSCCAGMRTDDGAVQQSVFHIGVVSKVFQHSLPDPVVTPARKPFIGRIPFFRNRQAADATAPHSGRPKSQLQRIVGTDFLSQHRPARQHAENPAFLSIGRLAVSRLS